MPYPTNASLPAAVKKLPLKGRNLWRRVWNSAYARTHDEGAAFGSAWAVVERAGYKKFALCTFLAWYDLQPAYTEKVSGPMPDPGQLLYVPLFKKDAKERVVGGFASTEAVDQQGEIVDLGAIEQAWPEYAKFGNIREMHQPWAAGKLVFSRFETAGETRGVYVEAKVVDDDAWKKVEEGVYNGFSLGGQKLEIRPDAVAPRGRVTKVAIHEISLVDRPANPEAVFSLVKFDRDPEGHKPLADGSVQTQAHGSGTGPIAPPESALHDPVSTRISQAELEVEKITWDDGTVLTIEKRTFDPDVGGGVDRDKLPATSFAGPDRSFPIVTPKDVHDAVRSLGRTKHDRAKVKAGIIRIARAKGGAFAAALPKEWKKEADAMPEPTAADLQKTKMDGEHSYEDTIREVREAIQRKHPMHNHVATFADRAISHDYDGNFFEHPYTMGADSDGDGGADAELGERKAVEQRFVPAHVRKMADVFMRAIAKRGSEDLKVVQGMHDNAVALGAICEKIGSVPDAPARLSAEAASATKAPVAGAVTPAATREVQTTPEITGDGLGTGNRKAQGPDDAGRENARAGGGQPNADGSVQRQPHGGAEVIATGNVASGDPTWAKLGILVAETVAKVVKGEGLEPLEKRLKALEDSPPAGGPVLNAEALRAKGLVATDKSAPAATGIVTNGEAELNVLRKMLSDETDPILREHLGSKIALAEIRETQKATGAR